MEIKQRSYEFNSQRGNYQADKGCAQAGASKDIEHIKWEHKGFHVRVVKVERLGHPFTQTGKERIGDAEKNESRRWALENVKKERDRICVNASFGVPVISELDKKAQWKKV